MISDTIDFKAVWEKAVDSIEHAIKQLSHPQEYGVISSNYIPYVSIVPVFAAIQSFYSTLDPTKQLNARRKIKHWYWASVFTKRYSGSVESTSAKDFIDIQKWIANSDDEPALIQELENNFRNIDFKGETKSGTSVYNGIFNLLVIKGAMDWMTGNVPQHDDLDDHHIIPASWGKKHLKGDLVHTILNRTPLSANTNRNVIGKKLPNEYLPELIKSNGEKTVRAILESHFVSSIAFDILLRDPFTPEDFEEFIAERQRTLQDAIENLLIKERLDLSSSLRELDEQIEWIELYVRSLILDKLDSDVTLVPSGVLEKVNDRISSLIKKKSNLDPTTFETLEGKLEQFDLRELQSTILNKSLWERFDSCFGTKQELETKFDQLAELRNAIRHSRAVDEVTKKEGEAAIVWFKQILESKSICI
ncbi:hypothetical protein H8D29_00575 [PVC group bacterium]|nr:hypothetical protein [PVC group bacterium]